MNALSVLKYSVVAMALVACNDGSSDELLGGGGSRRARQSQGTGAGQDRTTEDDGSSGAGGTLRGQDTGGPAPAEGNGSTPEPADETEPEGDGLDDFSRKALGRAKEWVDVKMPYCGGSNHGTDYLCGGTCQRSGIHASPAWDPYRTDCSGFVSWAWALPAPGRTTTGFAPFNTDITTAIAVDDLLPGDALNNENHVMLFGGWANAEHTKARILEEYDCGQVAVDRIQNVSKVSEKQVSAPAGTFTAIRLDSRPAAP